MDRQIIGVLKPLLEKEFHWSEIDYGNIVFAFQFAYAIGYLLMGRLMDVIGVRIGLGLAVVAWSLSAMGHALVRTVFGFQVMRGLLGLSEGGNFPASIKAVGEWFPSKERALATGIFNAGSNIGALLTPLLVPVLIKYYGWRSAFLVTGALGLPWLIAWWVFYRLPEKNARVSQAELAYIRSDPPDPPVKVPWLKLLRYRQTWAFVLATFLTGPVWGFYLFWVPSFLNKRYGLDLIHLGPPLVLIYLMADAGSIGGGWLSSSLIKRGWSVNAGRKLALLVCALCVVPVFAAAQVSSVWLAVFVIGLASAAHQGFSANLFTVVSDTMPRKAISTVVGIGGMAGAVGSMIIAKFMGYILDKTGSYIIPFAVVAPAYLAALLVIHLLLPRLQPAQFPTTPEGPDNPASEHNTGK
jgi:ACS family hexuronate transporter-like MFS transporter